MSHEQALSEQIAAVVKGSPLNRMLRLDGSPIFEAPIVGYADGHDPLFAQYKRIIGSFHLTPPEVLQHALDEGQSAVHLSLERVNVVCWVLPISRETRSSNRSETVRPSARWVYTKADGEAFNDALRREVMAWLRGEEFLAVAPALSPLFRERLPGMERGYTSRWSERHALYVAGLGTFGLSDGLITPKGVAMRCGSVVTNMPLNATPRPYTSHRAYCLNLKRGDCGECIARCPAGAISEAGHDKAKCARYVSEAVAAYREAYGDKTPACGLCQTGTPCEEGIP
jgi:epoxyqueuosine reductase